MGGDSAAAAGWDMHQIANPKVFRRGEFVIGYTTSFRMGQLLEYGMLPEKQTGDQSNMAYMSTAFVDAVRKTLKDGGFTTINNSNEQGGQFLVGYRGHLYIVQSGFSVTEYLTPYSAVGCGESYALGAMAIIDRDLPPKKQIKRALKTAAYFSNGVTGPFYVLKGPKS